MSASEAVKLSVFMTACPHFIILGERKRGKLLIQQGTKGRDCKYISFFSFPLTNARLSCQESIEVDQNRERESISKQDNSVVGEREREREKEKHSGNDSLSTRLANPHIAITHTRGREKRALL